MKQKGIYLVLPFLLIGKTLYSQNISELLSQLNKHQKEDSIKAQLYADISWEYVEYKADSAIFFAKKGIQIAKKKNLVYPLLDLYNSLGSAYRTSSKYADAIAVFEIAIELADKKNLLKKKCSITNNLANVYNNQKNYSMAILKYQEVMEMSDEIDNPMMRYVAISNLIGVYYVINKYEEAIALTKEAIELNKKFDDPIQEAFLFSNVGLIFLGQDKLEDALLNFNKAYDIYAENKVIYALPTVLNNLGIVYRRLHQYNRALDAYKESLSIFEEMKDTLSIAMVYENMSMVYGDLGQYSRAIEFAAKSLVMGSLSGDTSLTIRSNNILADNNLALHNIKKAMEYSKASDELMKVYREGKNSLLELEISVLQTKKAILEYQGDYKAALDVHVRIAELQNEFSLMEYNNNISLFKVELDLISKEKEIEQLNVINELASKENILNQEIIKKEAERKKLLVGLLVFSVVFFALLYNRFVKIRKQKAVIEQQKAEVETQKHIVEEKHKEITDSINYAERIQRSFLATKELLDNHLKDYFVFFKPKDVVSGDFYWAGELKNGNFAFSVADSTGHGVPGAIMSIANIACIKEAVTQDLSRPDEILGETRRLVIEYLKNDGSPEGGKDGMDCSLLVINKERTELAFAAAHNPVFIVREVTSDSDEGGVSRSETHELIEFKGDKMPVGKHDRDQEPFTLQTVQLQKGDVIYTLTDGFPDQFGGEKGKKYMIKNLKNLFQAIAHLPMSQQEEKLHEEFEAWRGQNEQVDDVCIIGVRI